MNFKAYAALLRMEIRLAFRQRVVIFFNYLMPLTFFFVFAQVFHAEQGGAILQVVTMVTVIGILGNGLLGAGMSAARDRETNILRRYKVAPITPLPLLVASTITGLVVYMPYVLLMLLLARTRYGMVMPQHLFSMLLFIMLGVVAMRAIGLIVASVVNSVQESGIIVQILYTGMLFLSGTTFPTELFPNWLLTATQFIPSTYLVTGMQGIMMRNESLAANWQATGALLLTTVLGLFLCVKLFRWEKEEKVRPAAKLWLAAVLLPFFVLGTWQAYAKDNVRKTKMLTRDLERSRTMLIRNARIVVGDGRVIENGAVLVKGGKIEEIYEGAGPEPQSVQAQPIEAAGKTVLPGLIDMHVHLSAPGGIYEDWKDYDSLRAMPRNLAAYLYSGVTAVRSVGDPLGQALEARRLVNSGEKQGAEFFTTGPLFTAAGGHGTEYSRNLPEVIRKQFDAEFTRVPGSAEEAKQQVDALKKAGVDALKAVLEAGGGGTMFNRMDPLVLNAIAAEGRADGLPVVVHTGDDRDVEDALRAGVSGIEHGSSHSRIPDADFAAMAKAGITYDPTLSVWEAFGQLRSHMPELLGRSLVQQVAPPGLLAGTRKALAEDSGSGSGYPMAMSVAKDNLIRAYKAGVTLITGTDAGNLLVIHGPTVQRELELWVEAGIPAGVALQAATLNAAKALGAGARFGSIEKGKDATMLVVDGNPLVDIKATEAVSFVMFKGERVGRADLFRQQ